MIKIDEKVMKTDQIDEVCRLWLMKIDVRRREGEKKVRKVRSGGINYLNTLARRDRD